MPKIRHMKRTMERSGPPYGRLGRCLYSLDELLSVHGRTSADGSRRLGANTAKQRKQDLKLLLKMLHGAGYPIVSIHNLRPKHLEALAKEMVRRKYKAATMQKYFTHLSRLCDWIGKPAMLQDPRRYFDDPHVYERHYAAPIPKTLPVPALDVDAVLTATYARDVRCGVWLELCHRFGLRASESLRFKPRELDTTDYIYFKGAKGRRYRTVPVEDGGQRNLLSRAREMAPSRSSSLIPPECQLKQAKNRFRNVIRHVGLTKQELGATPHSLRHGYARRLYRSLTGQYCPAEGGSGEGISRQEDRDARLLIADRLGHSRESITCAYLGPIVTLNSGK